MACVDRRCGTALKRGGLAVLVALATVVGGCDRCPDYREVRLKQFAEDRRFEYARTRLMDPDDFGSLCNHARFIRGVFERYEDPRTLDWLIIEKRDCGRYEEQRERNKQK